MAFKKLYKNGYVVFNPDTQFSFRVNAEDIEMKDPGYPQYSEYYGEEVFVYELEYDDLDGCFHLVVITNRDKILDVRDGGNAEGDGINYDLSHFELTYGRDPVINYIHGQYYF